MIQWQPALLITDWLIWGLTLGVVLVVLYHSREPHLREPWRRVFQKPMNSVTFVLLLFFVCVGLLASVHIRINTVDEQTKFSSARVVTALDVLVAPLGQQDEKTYSAPFALRLYGAGSQPRLRFGGRHLRDVTQRASDITQRVAMGLGFGLVSFVVVMGLLITCISIMAYRQVAKGWRLLLSGQTELAWRAALLSLLGLWLIIACFSQLVTHYHVFGTDKIGNDVFYQALCSTRTGLLIGTLTTVFMLPIALLLGTLAGFMGGVIDDIIQYLYTTLSSIPGVLLISASILVMQVYIANHPTLFPTLLQRADARLLALCAILGITSWASLCRLLRAETLKLREQEFIQAAKALGVGRLVTIVRHIVPNVMHIVLITLVLDFSNLVLAEAVLSYVGVGVDPTTASWGNMINSSRLELAREPIVWWTLAASFVFMFTLVLCANLFADAVRDAFDPRLRER